MKNFILAIFVLFSFAKADELSRAYQKEYAFLKTQKKELQKRLKIEKKQQEKSLKEAKEKVLSLQDKLLKISDETKKEKQHLEKLSSQLTDSKDNSSLLNNVLSQASSMLHEYNIKLTDSNISTSAKIERAFEETQKLNILLSSLRNEKGEFYLPDGSLAKGDFVKVGNIATYGISQNATGALAPAGGGVYKLWNAVGSSDEAKALFAGEMPKTLDIFIYENLDKEVDYIKEKNLEDTLEGGGTIGYLILILGAFGLLLLIYRVFNLLRADTNVDAITEVVIKEFENGGGSTSALKAIKDYEGSSARVIKSTLRNIEKERTHIEDIVMETILNESSQIDKFGSFVLVIAAVAPLMGLLGTVTGMIETFDVITEYGTGDPKLLSGGISAALVTTMFGLIVAIPLILLGNLVSGWAQGIKDSMEQSALHIVNYYEKHRNKE